MPVTKDSLTVTGLTKQFMRIADVATRLRVCSVLIAESGDGAACRAANARQSARQPRPLLYRGDDAAEPAGSPCRVGIECDEFVMGRLATHQKVRYIRRDPRVALSLLSYARNARIRSGLRHCASDRRRRGAPSATPGPDLPRPGSGIPAGRDAEHCGMCHQNHAGTLLRDWSVGSTTHRLTMSRDQRTT